MVETLKEKTKREVASSAADIDLVKVAGITGGDISFDGEWPAVKWANGQKSLGWYDVFDGKQVIEGRKRLCLWRGEFSEYGGNDMEKCGLVTGENFVAFVYPREELTGEIITREGITPFRKWPVGILNPVFLEARDIALKRIGLDKKAA